MNFPQANKLQTLPPPSYDDLCIITESLDSYARALRLMGIPIKSITPINDRTIARVVYLNGNYGDFWMGRSVLTFMRDSLRAFVETEETNKKQWDTEIVHTGKKSVEEK